MVGPKNVKTSATSLLQQRQHIDGVLYNYGNSSLSNFTGERKKTVQKRRCNSWNNKNTPESAESLDGYDCDVNSSKLFD